jgi:hypothetical protein
LNGAATVTQTIIDSAADNSGDISQVADDVSDAVSDNASIAEDNLSADQSALDDISGHADDVA